uniref:Uncharacterized protein n=1 Tax=Anguilla anguilla TaxID=7936 RepID=A0A0E9P960_ANGAN
MFLVLEAKMLKVDRADRASQS